MRRALAFGLVALLSGCSLFVSLGDLSSGTTTDARDGSSTDASGDAGSDATFVDSASDAGNDAAPPSRFCAGAAHDLCADFDDGGLIGFDGVHIDDGGLLQVLDAQASSQPFSLWSSLPRHDAGQTRATTYRQFIGPYRPAVVSADIFLVKPDWLASDINCAIFAVGFYGGATGGSIFLQISAGDFSLAGDVTGVSSAVTFPTDQWVHIELDVDPAGTVVAKIGTHTLNDTFPAYVSSSGAFDEIDVGINSYNAPVPAVSVYYDNITVDLK